MIYAFLIVFVLSINFAHSEEQAAPNPQMSPFVSSLTLPPSKKTKKSPKGKRSREKDTEGSEAPERFEADTVIKSKYSLHGEPLEVDPD